MDYSELNRIRGNLNLELLLMRGSVLEIRYKQLQQQLKEYPTFPETQLDYPDSWVGSYAGGALYVGRYYVSLRRGKR